MRSVAILAAILFAAVMAAAQQPQMPAGMSVTPLFENASVAVARLTLLPGTREMPHTHGYSMLIVPVTSGDIEMLTGTATTKTTRQIGDVDVVERGVVHAGANVGTTTLDAIIVAVKADRAKGGTAPPLPRPEGITARDVLDATDAAARRVELAPGAREVTHTHPYDFVVIPITRSRMELQLAGRTETKEYAPGEAFFIPRDTPHAVANPGREPLALIGVAIK
ncbi:MAG: cupin domain-containing protein [Acidimicrobiia bacterium]|nr:cupin domain-containing protein [Acidimicrobiia bacterium]